jgi:hypothetical protein
MPDAAFMASFNEADKVVHNVEGQWHYPILTRYGYEAVTKEAPGFVRSYDYVHPSGRTVRCTTGASADYWSAPGNKGGYWSDLEPYLKSVDQLASS